MQRASILISSSLPPSVRQSVVITLNLKVTTSKTSFTYLIISTNLLAFFDNNEAFCLVLVEKDNNEPRNRITGILCILYIVHMAKFLYWVPHNLFLISVYNIYGPVLPCNNIWCEQWWWQLFALG